MTASVQELRVVEVLHLLGDKSREMAILGAHPACLAMQLSSEQIALPLAT